MPLPWQGKEGVPMAPKLHPHPIQVNQAAERRMAVKGWITGILPTVATHMENSIGMQSSLLDTSKKRTTFASAIPKELPDPTRYMRFISSAINNLCLFVRWSRASATENVRMDPFFTHFRRATYFPCKKWVVLIFLRESFRSQPCFSDEKEMMSAC